MKKRSDSPEDLDRMREKIIGLGERSVRKSYYPKLQQQLQELEQLTHRHQLILQHAAEGIFGLDLQGNYTFMNKAAAAMLGYEDPAELTGKQSHSCIHAVRPDGTPYPEEECRTCEAFRSRTVRHVSDEFFCRKDGSTFPVEYTSSPIREHGEITGAVVTFNDITERKRSDEALRESEWRLEFATSLANEAIWDWDLATDSIARNDVYARTFGAPPAGADPTEWWKSRIHPEDRERVLSAFERIFKGERDDLDVEYHFQLADGTWGVVHDRAKAIRNSRGQPTRLIGMMVNITERKQAENRIRESEANLRTIMDSVYDAIFIHDLDGTILDVNRKMLELYRVDREQALRSRIVEDFSAPDNPFGLVPEIWKKAVSGEDQFFEWKAKRPNDDSVFDVEVFLHKITFQSKQLILANVRDVSARKKAEDALRRSETNYREIFESVNDAIFVHDIDTGNVLSVNRKTTEMFGYTQEEFHDFISEELFTGQPEYTAQDALNWISRAAEGPPQIFEWLSKKKTGELFWVEVNLKRAVIGGETRLLAIVRDITARKRIEEEVRRTKEQLEEAQKIAGIGSWERDMRTNTVGMSDELCRILGVPAGAYQGTFGQCLELVHPDERASVQKWLSEAALIGEEQTASREFRIVTGAGSLRVIHAKVRVERDTTGVVTRMRGTAQDVTESRHAEEALKLTQFSVDHASVSIFIVARYARFLYVNEEASRVLGYTREELLTMSVPDLDPDFPASAWDVHWMNLKEKGSLHFETRQRKKDGNLIPIDLTLNYFAFAGREYNIAFAQDISKRKKAEQRLQESEERFRQLAENTEQVFWFMVPEPEHVLYVSPAFSSIWGVPAEDLYRDPRLWAKMVHPDDHDRVEESFANWYRGISDSFDIDYRIVRPDGSVRWIRDRGTPVRDDQGRIKRLSGIADDITERKRIEQEIRRTKEQLEEAQHIAGIGNWEWDVRTNRLTWSDEVYRIFNVPAGEFKGTYEAFMEMVHPADRAGIERSLAEATSHWKKTAVNEYRIIRPDRSIRIIYTQLRLEYDHAGAVTMTKGTAQDVTEARRAEEAMKLTQFSLDHASVSAFYIDKDARIRYVNEQACRGLGYSRDELLQMGITDLDPHFPHERWGDHWEELKKEGFLRFESEHRRKDGTLMPVEISVNYLLFAGQEYNIGFALDISERKKAEDQLRHAYSLTKTIIDSMNDAISLIDVRNFTIIDVNSAFLKSYGYSDKSEVAGRHCYEITHHRPDVCSAPDDICPLIETVRSKDHFAVDHVHYDKQGDKIYVEVSTSPIRDDAGNVIQVVHIQRNITERKRAEEALRISESRFRNLFKQSSISMLILAPDGRILEVNQAFEQLWGVTIDDVKEYNILEDKQLIAKGIMPYIRKGFAGEATEIPVARYDAAEVGHNHGSDRWVKAFIYPVKREAGEIHQLVLMHLDMTEAVKAEEALRESEERFRAFFELAAVGAVQADPVSGRYLSVNDRFCRIMGYSREELERKSFQELTHPEERGRDAEFFAAIRRGELREYNAEKRYLHKDGHTIWGQISVAIIRDSRGRPVRTAAILQDITARKQAEEALRQSEAFIRRVMDNLIAFVGVLTPEGVLLDVNRSALNAAGVSSEDVLGKPFEETAWFSWSPDLQAIVRRAIGEAAQGKLLRFDMTVRVAGDRLMPLDFMLAPIIDEQGRVTHLIPSAIDITERKRMEDEIRHLAHHDTLTGLPNRRLFNEIAGVELAQAERNKARFALLFLDLDRFKEINDTLGHAAGDQLLKEVAARLRSVLRRSDSIGRIGGDEFNILLADLSHPDYIPDIARKLVETVRKPFVIAGHELRVTVSIGISVYPDDGSDLDTLLRYSDMAMYHAKEVGRNVYQFYNPAINSRSIERMRLENMLRRSLELGEMVVYYQPLIDVVTGKIICAEALIRWKHPEKGLLYPKDFISTAEETGFIAEIDEWVLRAVCTQIRIWLDAGLPMFCVTVNLSAREFQSPELLTKLAAILKETGTPPECIDIEIPESTAMRDVERSAGLMRQLAAMGVHISIDDFGTGYSSLNYLKRMPIEKLKIDQSFIMDITLDRDDRAIIQAVTAMAHSMHIKVIAEGVESREQLRFLQQIRCDEAQGYFFSRPVTAEKFRELVEAGR